MATEREPGEAWMERAVALAEGGRGRVSPNPMVGAVLVRDGRVVGEGFHRAAGRAHAEAEALAAAGAVAAGATCYVTLEPCAHHGRTPPCADALVAAGVARVVAAVQDPDPRVDGAGLARLRAAGVAVELGLGAEAAADPERRLPDPPPPRAAPGHPQGRGQPGRQGRGPRRQLPVDHRAGRPGRRPPAAGRGRRGDGGRRHRPGRRPPAHRAPARLGRPPAPAGAGRRRRPGRARRPPVRHRGRDPGRHHPGRPGHRRRRLEGGRAPRC